MRTSLGIYVSEQNSVLLRLALDGEHSTQKAASNRSEIGGDLPS
jgi:hypothetical protein